MLKLHHTDGLWMNRTGKVHYRTQKKGIYITITSDDEFDDNFEAAELCPVNIIKVEKF